MKTYVLPSKPVMDRVCSAQCRSLLEEQFEPVWNDSDDNYNMEQLEAMLVDAEVIITGFGATPMTEQLLSKATRLRYMGHAGGSVKHLLPRSIFDRGIKVFSANPRLAQ